MIGPLLQAVKLAAFVAFLALLLHLWVPGYVALIFALGAYWIVLSLFLR